MNDAERAERIAEIQRPECGYFLDQEYGGGTWRGVCPVCGRRAQATEAFTCERQVNGKTETGEFKWATCEQGHTFPLKFVRGLLMADWTSTTSATTMWLDFSNSTAASYTFTA